MVVKVSNNFPSLLLQTQQQTGASNDVDLNVVAHANVVSNTYSIDDIELNSLKHFSSDYDKSLINSYSWSLTPHIVQKVFQSVDRQQNPQIREL
jgi:hypothetical protein